MRERGRRTLARAQLAAAHESLARVSPGVGELDESAIQDLLRSDPDAAVALLADLSAATDPALRAQARRLAARLFVRAGRLGAGTARGYRRLEPGAADEGDLDVERTLQRAEGRPRRAEDLVARRWTAPRRAVCLLVDHSGSMRGHAVGLAAMAAAAVVLAREEGASASVSVIAFAADALVLQPQTAARAPARLVDDLLSLRGTGRTDLALALRTGARELAKVPSAERLAIMLGDCRATAGADPLTALAGLDRVDVLGTSPDEDAVRAGRALAARGRGRFLAATRYAELRSALATILH
ncbi:vWA domain-containing protein [Candidatus Solirubrobacter pratensis]|uniref:vWA domain-containing protein n=1 Tax=Candidatus Solirubrobacter pratensis TaxID=1298857 RepID=UPI0003F8AC9E|nr:vWA domain-containing protein [Candidatus Solirubrobacter pratensis]